MIDPSTSAPSPVGATGSAGSLGVALSRPAAGVAVLSVRGEIDALTADALERGLDELLAGADDRLVIDLSEVSFLASIGLAALIHAARRLTDRGLRLRLVATNRAVRRPLELTGLDQMFDLFTARESATGDSV